MHSTKLNNKKDINDFKEDDYVIMTSYVPSTDTYEEMTKRVPPAIEEKQKTPTITQDEVWALSQLQLFYHFNAARNAARNLREQTRHPTKNRKGNKRNSKGDGSG